MPAKRLRQYLLWAVIIIVLLVVEFFLYRSYLRVTVVANGKPLVLPKGSTVQTALARENIALPRGDLLDRDGGLVQKGKGGYPRILINGRQAQSTRELKRLDRIAVQPGEDLHERTVRKIEVVKSPLTVQGAGSFVTVSRHGLPGLKEVELGVTSRMVLSERTLREPSVTVVERFDKPGSKISLTFDDGPSPATPHILAILKEKQVPATFFVVGKQILKHPAILKEVARLGFDVGNHTFSHASLSQASYGEIVRELRRNEQLIEGVTGKRSHWFRPPGGRFSPLLLETSEAQGYDFILWSVDPSDWLEANAASIGSRVVSETGPGSVILLHDGGGNQFGTVRALPELIDLLRARGFSFVRLDEL